MDALDESMIPWISTNILAIILIFICWKRPSIGRLSFAFIFLLAAITNFIIGLQSPEDYLVYKEWILIKSYENFMEGYFSSHAMLVILSIALGQFLIAITLFFGGIFYKLAIIGGIIFFLAIAPLGIGSAFPSTVLFAFSMGILLAEKSLEKPSSIVI